MTIGETYIRFLQLVNRNATNNKINVDKVRFVLLFNDIQNRFVRWKLDKRNEDEIREIQRLLVQESPLVLNQSRDTHNSYSLPENYFDFANVWAKAKNDCCDPRRIHLFEVKSEDVEEKLTDVNTQPSFEFNESFYYFSNDSILIYKKDFEIDKVYLTYYRYPTQIDIEGYIPLDGTTPQNIDPEFDDKVVNQILVAMAKEFSAINADTAGYQLDKDRLFTI
jgi:hypothetical protein